MRRTAPDLEMCIRDRTYPAYRGIINKTDDEVAVALANVLRVAIMNRLADAYGSIPVSYTHLRYADRGVEKRLLG